MNILVISSNYPSSEYPQRGTFVYKVVQEFTNHNNEVVVVSPQQKRLQESFKSEGYGNENAEVCRPTHWSFSNKNFLKWNTYSLTRFFQSKAIKRGVKSTHAKPDIAYCHFISSALLYLQAFPNSSIPLFAAVGEYKNIDVVRSYYKETVYNQLLNKINGFIAVSPQVKSKLLEIGVPEHKIIVEPNGTDLTIFKPRNKVDLRKKYELPLDKKIVLFVGRFLDQKGALRALKAINNLEDNVVGVFIGKGPQEIEGDKVVFKRAVAHHQVAEFMALSDVFVLPTLHEGSSNVIIEAMASGLPIVSSYIPEIRVQCDSSFSILIDPRNVDQITEALEKITSDDELRKDMSEKALERSKSFDLSKRASRILEFIKKKTY